MERRLTKEWEVLSLLILKVQFGKLSEKLTSPLIVHPSSFFFSFKSANFKSFIIVLDFNSPFIFSIRRTPLVIKNTLVSIFSSRGVKHALAVVCKPKIGFSVIQWIPINVVNEGVTTILDTHNTPMKPNSFLVGLRKGRNIFSALIPFIFFSFRNKVRINYCFERFFAVPLVKLYISYIFFNYILLLFSVVMQREVFTAQKSTIMPGAKTSCLGWQSTFFYTTNHGSIIA